MNSPTPRSPRSRSQVGGRRTSRAPLHLHSDCPPESEDLLDSPSLGQRSVSLTTLQPTIIQPRMAQLETLEAKMASIEVSLSSTPRRKKNGSIGGISLGSSIRSVPKEIALKELENLRNALRDKENIILNLKGQLGFNGLPITHIRPNGLNNNMTNRDLSEVEKKQAEDRLSKLKIETDNKRLAIKNLKMALDRLDITDNIDVRIQQAELEYQLGREELNLLTLLEETRALQICLDESSKNNSEFQTFFSCVQTFGHASLHAVEIVYDPKSPRFGAGTRDSHSGLWIDWALEDTGLCKEDRLIEVNGKFVLNKTHDDLIRLLAAAPDPAQLVLLRKFSQGNKENTVPHQSSISVEEVTALRRELGAVKEKAEETQKSKDGLVSDNIRLTHRICYLEEQVTELLSRRVPDSSDIRIVSKAPVITSTVKTNQNVTNINISSLPQNNSNQNDLQIFKRGSQITTLVANCPGLDVPKESHATVPGRSKSSLSNVSNTHIQVPNLQHPDNRSCQKSHRHHHRNSKSKSSNSLDDFEPKPVHKSHHHNHSTREKDYYCDVSSNDGLKDNSKTSIMDQSYKRASMIVHDLTKSNDINHDNVYEKHKQKCITASEKYNGHLLKHYNSRKSASVLDFRSQITPPNSRSIDRLNATENHKNLSKHHKRLVDARSVKSLDFDSDCNSNITRQIDKIIDYTSEPLDSMEKIHHHHPQYYEHIKPKPPKKPLRLSLHKTQSLQSVESSDTNGFHDKHDSRKPMKRNHRGQTQQVPIINIKFDGSQDVHKTSQKEYLKKNSLNGLSALKWTSFASSKLIEN